MESIRRDLAALEMSSSSKKLDILDVVGSDIDGTFRDALTY
jgi:hypothetical protein